MKKLFTFFAALGLAITMQAANIAVSGLQYCDAYYWTYEDEESGSSLVLYDFDLYVDYDNDTEILTYPEVYVQVPANSKTALNGTYEIWYAGYWKSAKDSVETDDNATDAVGTITFKNVDADGNYQVTLSFTATDGNTYTVNETVNVWAFDVDNYAEITLSEGGSAPAGDMLTCAEAAQIAAANGYKGTTEVTVYGYVTELLKDKVDDNGNQKQSFWMADTKDGGQQFEAYWAFVPAKFAVGDRVSVTGILQNYNGTIEIADGQAALLGEGEGGGNEPDEPSTSDAIYQIDFKTDITGWTIDDKDLGGLTYVWKQDTQYGMKGSAFANQQAYAAESWLISSTIDLSNAKTPSLVLTQALNKGVGANLAVKVSADNGATWTNLSINMPAGTSWDFQEDQASLAAYAGKKIQIAFAYKSTTSDCPTWEIGTVRVVEGTTGLEQTTQEGGATKVLRNGQVYILRGGKAYNMLGAIAE